MLVCTNASQPGEVCRRVSREQLLYIRYNSGDSISSTEESSLSITRSYLSNNLVTFTNEA